MRLDPRKRIYGIPPKHLRDCARRLADKERFTAGEFIRSLGGEQQEARRVLARLKEDQFVTQQDNQDSFVPTPKMRRLAAARVTHGISRPVADKMLSRLVGRAKHINSDSGYYGYRLEKVAVFGSYLSNEPVIGDLDIAFSARWAAKEGGAHVVSPYDACRRLLRFLRHERCISLHDFGEVVHLKAKHKIVFVATAPRR
jgi:hypothetical protein